VFTAPSAKGLGPAIGSVVQLSFTIANPNASLSLTGLAFSDTLPSGLVVAPGTPTTACGTGTVSALGGSNVFSLSGGTLSAGTSCTFSVNLLVQGGGTLTNTTGNITSAQTLPGNQTSATITTAGPQGIQAPVLSLGLGTPAIQTKGTGEAQIHAGDRVPLNVILQNPNSYSALTVTALSTSLPTGLTINGAPRDVGFCQGRLHLDPGNILLLTATLPAGALCTATLEVVPTTSGTFNVTITAVTSLEAGRSNPASVTLTVS
jgi:uncharacterized repeat protein (TIGR01451 family)